MPCCWCKYDARYYFDSHISDWDENYRLSDEGKRVKKWWHRNTTVIILQFSAVEFLTDGDIETEPRNYFIRMKRCSIL